MANETQGPLSLTTMDLAMLNDRLRRIRDELDYYRGLRGPIQTYDSTRYYDANNQLLHGWGDCTS